MTDQSWRQVLHKPEASGRLVKWSVELSEFDISYQPQVAIKAQAILLLNVLRQIKNLAGVME